MKKLVSTLVITLLSFSATAKSTSTDGADSVSGTPIEDIAQWVEKADYAVAAMSCESDHDNKKQRIAILTTEAVRYAYNEPFHVIFPKDRKLAMVVPANRCYLIANKAYYEQFGKIIGDR